LEEWSLTGLLVEKVVKIGAKGVAHGRYLVFQMTEVAVPQELFWRVLDRIRRLRPPDRSDADARRAGCRGIGGRGAHASQTSLRTSSIVKPRKVSLTAFPRPAMMSAIFATVSSSGASVIAIWSY
jgi:hypothetical protein